MGNGLSCDDTVFVFYDLELAPATYDILYCMMAGEALRVQKGLKKVFMIFVPGKTKMFGTQNKNFEKAIPVSALEQRLANILIPIASLLPSNSGHLVAPTREFGDMIRLSNYQNVYPTNYLECIPSTYKLSDLTRNLPMTDGHGTLKTKDWANSLVDRWLIENGYSDNQKLVVISMRNSSYTPKRNSNFNAWFKFAGSLDKRKYFLVFLVKNSSDLIGHESFLKFEQASLDSVIRASLFQRAYINLGVNTGPFMLTFFLPKCRYIMFKVVTESSPSASKHFFKQAGIEPGSNPFSVSQEQIWVWQDDDYEVITEAFSDFEKNQNNKNLVNLP